jgi:hypothetical protein
MKQVSHAIVMWSAAERYQDVLQVILTMWAIFFEKMQDYFVLR